MQRLKSKEMESFAQQVVERLCSAGFVAYFAGGCVRDSLLERRPKDYDIATSATPNEVREVFGRSKTLAIGASFGVITVLGPKPHQVEVATFRSDGEYTDGRHPDGVVFSNAEEDAKRRDFTINGMFFDPIGNNVIDFVGGEEDLKSKLIRAIGNPQDRIEEDRLRMLRAIRFAATYDFAIEADTMAAVRENADKIRSVSQERITTEVSRMLGHPNRAIALELLAKSKLLPMVFPKVAELEQEPEIWSRLKLLLRSEHLETFPQTLALLLGRDGVDLQPPEADGMCRSLKLSNEIRQSVVWVLAHREKLSIAHQLNFSEIQPLLIEEPIEDALAVLRTVATTDAAPTDAVVHCEHLLKLDESKLNPAALIGGKDLMEMGIQAGPQFKELLHKVRIAQLDGIIHGKAEAIGHVRKQLESS